MKLICCSMFKLRVLCWLVAGLLALTGVNAGAVPSLVSTAPANDAINVPVNSSVSFVFSEAMDPLSGYVQFFYQLGDDYVFVDATGTWSVGNTVFTYSPDTSWPTNTLMYWSVSGENLDGVSVQGEPAGAFMTVGPNEHLGYGTNATTLFAVGKGIQYLIQMYFRVCGHHIHPDPGIFF